MDLAVNITSSCRVRVLLVPVAPIKKSTFWKHVELVKQFSMVRLGDVTPDLQKGASAKFSSQVFQEGQMHFQFVTSYRRDHAHLEDFQPHRRIFGVIGIMDCQEWKDKDLSEGYKHFVNTLNKYPTAIATRCFAFDPTENQPDDTKGLIMIPNVGNLSFYMSTMVCDFASEILSQFANIATRIESLPSLESPMQVQYQVPQQKPHYTQQQQQQQFYDHTINNGHSTTITPQPSASTPTGAKLQHRTSQPPPTPAPTHSTSSSFLKRASSMASNNSTTASPTFNKMATLPPIPSPSMSRTNSAQGTSDLTKTKRRTPGRIKKLFADFYLLAGRLPDAVSHYQQAIEMTKTTSDFLWLASAMEGLACATLLLEYLQGDIGHIVSRKVDPPSPTESPMSPTTTNKDHGMEDISLKPAPSTFTELIDQYTALIQYYNKVHTTSSIPLPGLVYAEACIKVSRLLLTVYINKGWNDQVLALVVQGKISPSPNTDGLPPSVNIPPTTSPETTNKTKTTTVIPIPRYEIAEWVMRIWSTQLDQLPLLDQINFMTQMSTILSCIGYHRKAAWSMHESIHCMLPLLIQSRATLSNAPRDPGKGSEKNNDGILQVLKRICEVYGIGERNVLDGGALNAMQNQDQGTSAHQARSLYKQNARVGWATLQIDILRQCIAISEALPDYGSMLYYTTVLLKNLYQYIPKDEQIRLASSIQRIVAMGKRSGHVESNVNYWGVNIVTAIEAVQAIPRKAVYEHPVINKSAVATTKATGDPFIYNPFAQKKNEENRVNLVKNELCEFKVTLTNPFGFDLELQNATLSTSGVPFNPVPMSASIPAYGTISLRLTGTPEESGTLLIRGCIIRIVGFAEQEFIHDLSAKKKMEQNKNNKQEPTYEDFAKFKYTGLQAIQNASKKQETNEDPGPIEYYKVQVIDDQPLLKITSTSLLHGAVMLYEGEMTHIKMEIENIGNIPVDFITLSFTDSTSSNPLPINTELPMEQQYEIELFIKDMPVFSWEGSSKDRTQSIGKKIYLDCGEKTEIIVNVYGKRGCSGGTIQMDYGYLDRLIDASFDSTVSSPSPPESSPSSPSSSSLTTSFFTRQLYLPVLVTVYQNLEPLNWDILYLRHSGAIGANNDSLTNNDERQLVDGQQPVEDLILLTQQAFDQHQDKNEYCLVTLDIRNTWTVPFDVSFKVDDLDKTNSPVETVLSIQPGWTRRLVLPVKRMFLSAETCRQPIPSFEPNKQFVVSQGPKMAPEQERARLLMFWYREKLLERIQATWQCQSTGRHGILNLRPSLRLSTQQLAILKKEDIEFLVDLEGPNVHKTAHRQFQCDCNDFITMQVSIRNRQVRPVKLILRVQPVQSYNSGAKEYDLSGKLLMQGLHQIVLPEIPANGMVTHVIPLCFLSRGRFEFLYHVEDVHTREMYYDHDWAIVDCQ
ncbi:TRAPP II complex [Halteromyces radiatus]|uniref:TRAPP II complex n=1 Tax=Halteromyces radiatus TaxID=101107 RepID=UPI00221E86CA|nr:TRAPP II complex [Halteromyces radiatus]KAI8098748.1 TRAPP II complex [Halteromyces radiatus]